MFTFLPEGHKQRVLAMYHKKLFLIELLLLNAVLLLGCAFFVPTFLAAKGERDVALTEKNQLTAKIDSGRRTTVESQIQGIKDKVSALKTSSGSLSALTALERALSRPRVGIVLNGIAFSLDREVYRIGLDGRAATRENLVAFVKALQGEPSFAKVDLPVGSLAKSADVPFNLSIETHP
jgi:hypothetical protein